MLGGIDSGQVDRCDGELSSQVNPGGRPFVRWAEMNTTRNASAVSMQLKGGTGYQPVLGGNLPPSLARQSDSLVSEIPGSQACGLVAHRNGQVARSTLNRIA